MGSCIWPKTELEQVYHDQEWCVPKLDDREIFEWLVLEMMQAGLSWRIILNKREGMRQALDNFQPELIAQYDIQKLEVLMLNSSIIRNRKKLQAVTQNARAFIKVQKEWGSFANYIWHFVRYEPIMNHLKEDRDSISQSNLSRTISKSMKQYGFSFVGPTIVYSFMQAIGLINDHLLGCDYYDKVQEQARLVKVFFE